jgi:hypothetical protein
MVLRNATTAESLAPSGQTASNLFVACGVGGGHLNKECPEKGNTSSTLACYKCQLVEEQKVHPSNYTCCRHAKEEMHKWKSQRESKSITVRVFSSNFTTPGLSLMAAL